MASMEYDERRWANRYYAKPGKFANMDRTMRDMACTYEWTARMLDDRLTAARANAGRYMDYVRR